MLSASHTSNIFCPLPLIQVSMNVVVRENATVSEETESWILYFQLVGATPEQEFAEVEIDRKDLTFGNLLTMKSRFGYSVRDFLYYKERCGNGVAKMIEIDDELDADGMITMNGEESEVRLVLSRDKIIEQNVTITPIKLPPGMAFMKISQMSQLMNTRTGLQNCMQKV